MIDGKLQVGPLFDSDERYTSDAVQLEDEIRAALIPVYNRARDRGVAGRDLLAFVVRAAHELELELVLALDDAPDPRNMVIMPAVAVDRPSGSDWIIETQDGLFATEKRDYARNASEAKGWKRKRDADDALLDKPLGSFVRRRGAGRAR